MSVTCVDASVDVRIELEPAQRQISASDAGPWELLTPSYPALTVASAAVRLAPTNPMVVIVMSRLSPC